jgi:hypothetical protein
MQTNIRLWMTIAWILGGVHEGVAQPESPCRVMRDGIFCPSLSPKEQKEVKRLCHEAKISLVCGNSKCKGPKNDLNCPCDCKNGKDHAITEMKTGSYNGRTFCPATQITQYAESEVDIIRLLQESREKNRPVKAVGASHTDNAAICTSGTVIATNKMKTIFGIHTKPDGTRVVRAQAGVTIGELGRWLHERNYVNGYGIVGYHLVTLAGVLGTGAHGSAVKHSALLSDSVYTIRMVLADGRVETFSRATTGKTDPTLWNALRVNLGMFGIISEVEIEIQDDFLIQMTTKAHHDDALYTGESIWNLVRNCDIASVSYFPPRKSSYFFEKNHPGKAIVNCGTSLHKVPSESWSNFSKKADPGAQFVLHAPYVWDLFWGIYIKRLHRSVCDNSYACTMESLRRHQLVDTAPYIRHKSASDDGWIHRSEGITGFAFSMQNSTGSERGMQFRQTDWEVAIPFRNWAKAFQILRDYTTQTQEDGTPKFCLPLMGVYIRFSQSTDALMSHGSIGGSFRRGEPVMFMELPEFIPSFDIKTEEDKKLADHLLAQHESLFRGFVEIMLERVEARVHWAKNRPELLHMQQETNPVRKAQIKTFNDQIIKLDPTGVFSNDFMNKLGIHYPTTSRTQEPEKLTPAFQGK